MKDVDRFTAVKSWGLGELVLIIGSGDSYA